MSPLLSTHPWYFSVIQAASPAGESASENPSVCGFVLWISMYPALLDVGSALLPKGVGRAGDAPAAGAAPMQVARCNALMGAGSRNAMNVATEAPQSVPCTAYRE